MVINRQQTEEPGGLAGARARGRGIGALTALPLPFLHFNKRINKPRGASAGPSGGQRPGPARRALQAGGEAASGGAAARASQTPFFPVPLGKRPEERQLGPQDTGAAGRALSSRLWALGPYFGSDVSLGGQTGAEGEGSKPLRAERTKAK